MQAKQSAQAIKSKETTRQLLLFKALELYAERGIDNVSLREIGVEVGAKNSSAVLYHFGSKEMLLNDISQVILARIFPEIDNNLGNLERHALQGKVESIEIIHAILFPLKNLLEQPVWGKHAITFIARTILEKKYDHVRVLLDHFAEAFKRLIVLLQHANPSLKEEQLRLRSIFATTNLVLGMATIDVLQDTSFIKMIPDNPQLLLEEFTHYLLGGLTSPSNY